MAKAPVPNITKKDLEEWERLENQRKEASREARDLQKQQDIIEAKIKAFVEAKGGKSRSVERSGFRLALEKVKQQVAWKTEYIALAGQEQAEQLVADAPLKEVLAIERLR